MTGSVAAAAMAAFEMDAEEVVVPDRHLTSRNTLTDWLPDRAQLVCGVRHPPWNDGGDRGPPPTGTLVLPPQVERLDAHTIRVVVPDARGASGFMSVAPGYDPTEQ
jgi:hypothetical protein